MQKLLVAPPVAFIIILITSLIAAQLLSRLAFRTKKQTRGGRESYACGEKDYNHMAQPDYSNFFPFAFFFTLAHVATLMMTTVPVAYFDTFIIAALYILGAALGLYTLFRK